MNSLIPEVSTKFNFIHLSNGGSESSAATGDFWFTIALPFLIIAIIAAAIYVYANRKRFSKIDFKALGVIVVSSVLVTGFVQGASKAIAAEDFTGKQIDVIVNEAGGPVSYGEGENSNVQTIKNTTDDLIWFDQINLKDESGSSFVGHWTAKMDDGTTLFDGGAGDSYILANRIVINSGESITVTWTTDTDSSELLGNSGVNETYIEYLLNDPNLTVSFESNGGSAVPSASVRYGETVAKPTDPGKDYYDFIYWTVDEDLQVEVNFNDPIYEDTTYFAKWDLAQDYKDQLCGEVTATANDLKSRIEGCTHITEAAKEVYAQEIDTKASTVNAEIQGLHTKEDADSAKQDADSWFLDEAKIAFKSDFTECRGSDAEKIKALELLTQVYKTQVLDELSSTYEEGVSQIDSQTTIADANNTLNEYEGKCDAFYTAAVAFRDNKIAGKDNIDAAVAAANATIDAAEATTYLKQVEATAYKATISTAATEGKSAIDAVDFPEDLQGVINTYLGTINNTADEASSLATLRKNTIEPSSAKANALLQTVINSNWFNQTYITNLSTTLNTKTTNFKDTAMGTQNPAEINDAYNVLSSELDMLAADIQSLIILKKTANAMVTNSANNAYTAIDRLTYYSYTQKQALRSTIETDLNTAHTNLINSTDEVEINNIAANFAENVEALTNGWMIFNQEKESTYYELQGKFNDGLETISDYSGYLSEDDIQYFSQDIEAAQSTLYDDICNIETSNALNAFVEAQNAMVDNSIAVAKARRDKKEAAQNDLTTKNVAHLQIVDDAQLALQDDITFYKDGINELYEDYQGYIRDIPPYEDEDVIDECVEYGDVDMKIYSDAAKEIEGLRVAALERVESRQSDFDAAIGTIVGLTTDDVSSYKESFAAVQKEVITDQLNGMHFGEEIEEAEAGAEEEAAVLISDAQALPSVRASYLLSINDLEERTVEWITSLEYPTDPQKDEWTAFINEAVEVSAAKINDECHKTDEVEREYGDFIEQILTPLKASAQVETEQTASWAFSSNIFPLYDSGELNEYDYFRLSDEVQSIVIDFNAALENISDPDTLMYQTDLTTFTISRYGEGGNLRPVKITTQSAFIEFVYGEGEHQVTSSSFNIYGFGMDSFKVKVNIEDGHELDQIIDNNGNTYTLDADGYFTFEIGFNLTTITVTEK